jgi:hypothetical protein
LVCPLLLARSVIGIIGEHFFAEALEPSPIDHMSVVLQPLHFVAIEVISVCRNTNAINAVVQVLSDEQRITVVV